MKRFQRKYLSAVKLRKKGYSLDEIGKRLGIAKSTTSLWLRDVELPPPAIERLANRGNLGRARAQKTRELRRRIFDQILENRAEKLIKSAPLARNHRKIICALLFWCEGSKNTKSGVHFVNSDPSLIKTFLALFRSSFKIDEKRLRICLHLHEYHSTKKQISFWSKITDITIRQFIKPYKKPHTGKRIRKNYPGCVNVAYHDSALARELTSIAKQTLNNIGA